jgi:small-conductance mechanosensitive channel
LFWIGFSLILVFIVFPLLKRITKKTKTEADDIIFNTIKKPFLGITILYGVVSSLAVLSIISEELLSNLFLIYGLVLLLTLGYVIYKLFHNIVIYYGKKWTEKTETEFDDMLINVVEKIGNIIILACIGLSLLSYFGIDITILLAGMGVLGIVIGFAAQDTLSNLFSGIQLILDAPFRIGDYIIFEGGEDVYEVKDVGLRSTKLYDLFEHTVVVIPNKILADNKIINLKRPDTAIKTSVSVGVAYGTDVKKVEDMLMEIGLSHPHVLKTENRKPFVRFSNFGESSLDFVLYVWVDDILNQWATKSELRDMIYARFAEENIQIPFPQRDIWIKKE